MLPSNINSMSYSISGTIYVFTYVGFPVGEAGVLEDKVPLLPRLQLAPQLAPGIHLLKGNVTLNIIFDKKIEPHLMIF